jgi:hypothetical protein
MYRYQKPSIYTPHAECNRFTSACDDSKHPFNFFRASIVLEKYLRIFAFLNTDTRNKIMFKKSQIHQNQYLTKYLWRAICTPIWL